MRYWLWAIPKGETDRLYERPLTSFALTPKQVEQVRHAAGAEGWHSFRTVPVTAMRYTVTKQVIEVLGVIWLPAAECAQRLELSAYDMANLGNPRNRDDVARWLHTHAGDFQSITDFRADFHVDTCTRCGANSTNAPSGRGKRTCKAGHAWRTSHIVHEWARGEDSVMAFNDAMYGHIDAED